MTSPKDALHDIVADLSRQAGASSQSPLEFIQSKIREGTTTLRIKRVLKLEGATYEGCSTRLYAHVFDQENDPAEYAALALSPQHGVFEAGWLNPQGSFYNSMPMSRRVGTYKRANNHVIYEIQLPDEQLPFVQPLDDILRTPGVRIRDTYTPAQ
jgi:hypothetical protein